jgi:hypothetical protein
MNGGMGLTNRSRPSSMNNSQNSIHAIKPPDPKKGNCMAGSGLFYRTAKQMSSPYKTNPERVGGFFRISCAE